MNRLPDMMVLDFCEWLKKKAEYDYEQRKIDILDLIFNEEYNSRLEKYAEEYLAHGEYSLKSLLHHFIDSKEGSVMNFVSLVINGSNLARIRYEYSYQEGTFYYGYSKGTIETNHFRKRHQQYI